MKRKKLKEDHFAESVEHAVVVLKSRRRLVIRVAVALVLVAGFSVFARMRVKERQVSAENLLNDGKQLLAEGRLSEAKDIFQDVGAEFPDSPLSGEALIYRAESLCRLNRMGQAGDVFRKYLSDYPNGKYRMQAQNGLGYVLEEEGELRLAIDAYSEIFKNYPEHYLCPAAMVSVGCCYEALEDLAQAKEIYEELLSRYPWSSEGFLAKSRLDILKREIARASGSS